MRAITITAPGGPEVLRIAEVPDPVPAAGEVVIEAVLPLGDAEQAHRLMESGRHVGKILLRP
jgi:NADPH:quinone reductase-like Zn-dependent oxidoreductase